jgi:hypothetical protein
VHERSTGELAHAEPEADEKLAAAAAVGKNAPLVCTPGPGDEMPPEYWQAVMDDAAAGARATQSLDQARAAIRHTATSIGRLERRRSEAAE